ncbi:MAG: hypothetical protein ACRCXC_02205 [Legionella sp.]
MDIECEPIYAIPFYEDGSMPQWLSNFAQVAPELLKYFGFPGHAVGSLKQLINMWIKRGDNGINTFFNELTTTANAQPELLHF